jgi:hypothetical protein
MNVCVERAPTAKMRSATIDTRDALIKMMKDNNPLVTPYCKTDLPAWKNCLGTGHAGSPAIGQTKQPTSDWTQCLNFDKEFSLDDVIRGCTAVIQAGTESERRITDAYFKRSRAYEKLGDSRRAKADFNEVERRLGPTKDDDDDFLGLK